MKKVFLLIILLSGFLQVHSQNTCTDQLRAAQTKFDEGSLDEIPQLIEACMKEGFTDEEKTNAYKLLIQTYLFNEQPEKADEVMLQFLREFPSYALAVNDPKEFVNLYGTYRTKPIMKFQITGGMSLGMPAVTENFSLGNTETAKTKYTPMPGLMTEINYINTINRIFDYSIGGSFSWLRYGYTSTPLEFTEVTGTYSNMYVGMPLTVRYNYKFGKGGLAIRAGIEPVYLLSSKVELTRKDITRPDPITGTEDFTSYHNKIDIRPVVSMGLNFKIRKLEFLVTAGMKFGSINVVNKEKIEDNEVVQQKYSFIEDRMILHQSYISISYMFSIYKPKKIR